MALIQRGLTRKKQLQLIIALGGIIGITSLVLYYGILKESGPQASETPVLLIPVSDDVRKLPAQSGLDAMQSLFELPVFRALRQFGVWPLSSEPKGKLEPFVIPQ